MFKGIVLSIVCALLSQPAMARDKVEVVGSTTAYYYATTVAGEVSQDGKVSTPVIRPTGTNPGFKLFCEGTGENTPDITGASRKMSESERQACTQNGVVDPIEVPLGRDAIIFADKAGTLALSLTKKQIFMALARSLPGTSGKLSPNTYQTWNQIDPSLPNWPIKIYGPAPGAHPLIDRSMELLMEKGCGQFKQFIDAYPDKNDRALACQSRRDDGKYLVSDGSTYKSTLERVKTDDQALGIFGYGFYERHFSELKPVNIDGVAPGDDTILSGKYDGAFNLYFYIKRQHIGLVPGIVEIAR